MTGTWLNHRYATDDTIGLFTLPFDTSSTHVGSPICAEFIETEYNDLGIREHQCHHSMYFILSDEAPEFGSYKKIAFLCVIQFMNTISRS